MPDGGTQEQTRHAMTPFTSRIVVDWLTHEPERRHRRIDDAALIFLDISGFTAMSEMLASLGRVGSEEVREVVNQTFTGLLDLAYSEGASLLKFGGDALLLLLQGPGCDQAAVRAAWMMRERLHASNPVTTAAGSLDLDMTVGVHVGPVDLFLVGESHRELVVAGTAGTAVIDTEGQAERGQILLSPDVPVDRPGMEVLQRDDGLRELLGVAPFEGNRPAPMQVPPLPPGQPVLSGPVHQRVLEDRRGEHRTSTIAFVHFGGTDAVLHDEGPEALAEALHELTTVVQSACSSANVCFLASDIDADGGKMILTAGVPTAADDDDDRMINACRQIVEAHPRLHVQIGVNRGPVFSGVVGPDYRLTYTVLGDAVNLAARIMARADHGHLLAESSVMNRCRTLHDITALEPFNVKGKVAPVRAVDVGPEIGVRIRVRQDDTQFVGRGPELTRLADLVDQVEAQGYGAAVALVGPAGIGKSRLIDELQEMRPTVPLQLIACSRFGAERPYRAAGMLLRLVLTGERHGPAQAVLDEAERLATFHEGLAEWLPLLGDVYDVDIPDTPETAALAANFRGPQTRRIISLLLASALWGSAIIVVEDIQWLDPESRELLVEQGIHVLQDRPWLVVGTTRDADTVVEGMEVIELGPLSDEASRQLLLAAVDRGELTIDWTTAIAERAGGNPLFLIELIRASGQGELPDSLESLFLQRLDALPPGQRRLLAHAAVLGLEFPPDLLQALSETHDDVEVGELPQLGEFVSRMRSGYWRFTQSLYQEVAYSSLPYRTRRRLHGAAATALEQIQLDGGTVVIEALSRHHHLGGDYEKSWKSSRQAFAVARGRSAVESAARFARRALEAGRRIKAPDAPMARLWEGLGDVLELSGAYPDAEQAYRAARKHDHGQAEVRLCRKVGHIKERRGEYSQALRWYSAAERATTEAGDNELVRTRVRRAVTLMRQGRRRDAERLAMRLLSDEIAKSPDDRAGALWIVGWAGAERQSPDAIANLQEAARLFGEAGDLGMQAVVINAIGADEYFRGDWTAATSSYRRARELWEQAGDRGNVAVASANLGEILGDQGRFDEARALLRSANEFGRATRHETLRAFTLLYLGRAAARSGDAAAARAELEDALSTAERLGAGGLAVEAQLRLAEVALFEGLEDLATATLDDAVSRAGSGAHPGVLTWATRLRGCLHLHRGHSGLDQLRQAVDLAASANMRYDEFLARATLLAHGDTSQQRWVARRSRELGVACPPEQLVHGPRPWTS